MHKKAPAFSPYHYALLFIFYFFFTLIIPVSVHAIDDDIAKRYAEEGWRIGLELRRKQLEPLAEELYRNFREMGSFEARYVVKEGDDELFRFLLARDTNEHYVVINEYGGEGPGRIGGTVMAYAEGECYIFQYNPIDDVAIMLDVIVGFSAVRDAPFRIYLRVLNDMGLIEKGDLSLLKTGVPSCSPEPFISLEKDDLSLGVYVSTDATDSPFGWFDLKTMMNPQSGMFRDDEKHVIVQSDRAHTVTIDRKTGLVVSDVWEADEKKSSRSISLLEVKRTEGGIPYGKLFPKSETVTPNKERSDFITLKSIFHDYIFMPIGVNAERVKAGLVLKEKEFLTRVGKLAFQQWEGKIDEVLVEEAIPYIMSWFKKSSLYDLYLSASGGKDVTVESLLKMTLEAKDLPHLPDLIGRLLMAQKINPNKEYLGQLLEGFPGEAVEAVSRVNDAGSRGYIEGVYPLLVPAVTKYLKKNYPELAIQYPLTEN